MQSKQEAAAEIKERRLHQRIMAPERALVALSGDTRNDNQVNVPTGTTRKSGFTR